MSIKYNTLLVYVSPGSVTDTDTEVFQNTDTDTEVGIPNTEKYRISKKKYRKQSVNRYFNFVNTTLSWSELYARSGGQLSQIESFPLSVYSVILHKIVMTIQYSLS